MGPPEINGRDRLPRATPQRAGQDIIQDRPANLRLQAAARAGKASGAKPDPQIVFAGAVGVAASARSGRPGDIYFSVTDTGRVIERVCHRQASFLILIHLGSNEVKSSLILMY